MVKGRLLEPQSPVMQAHIPRSASEAGSPGERADTAEARTLRRVGGGQQVHSRGRTGHLRRARTSMTEGRRDGLRGASPMVTEVPSSPSGSRPTGERGNAARRAKGTR